MRAEDFTAPPHLQERRRNLAAIAEEQSAAKEAARQEKARRAREALEAHARALQDVRAAPCRPGRERVLSSSLSSPRGRRSGSGSSRASARPRGASRRLSRSRSGATRSAGWSWRLVSPLRSVGRPLPITHPLGPGAAQAGAGARRQGSQGGARAGGRHGGGDEVSCAAVR